MITRITLLASLLVLPFLSQAQGEPKTVSTEIKAVTVFLNGAQVTRNARASLAAGTQQIKFTGLTAQLDPGSVQVQGEGDFTILSVTSEMNYPEPTLKDLPITEIVRLQTERLKISDKLSLEEALLQALNESFGQEKAVWGSNRTLGTQETPPSAEAVLATGQMYRDRETEFRRKIWEANIKTRDLKLEIAGIDKRIGELKASAKPEPSKDEPTREVIVALTAKAAVTGTFSVSYLVQNAGWLPAYDLRVKDVNSPLGLIYKANVYQATDEDWKNVKLTLSTGNPNQSGQKPTLAPWYLRYYTPPPPQVSSYRPAYSPSPGNPSAYNIQTGGQVSGRITDASTGEPLIGATIVASGTTVGTFTDLDGNFTLNVPPGVSTLTINYIGFSSQQIPVQGNLNVALQENVDVLDEVVITGYSTESDIQNIPSLSTEEVRMSSTRINATAQRAYKDAYRTQQQKKVKQKAETRTVPIVLNQVERATNVEFQIETPYNIPASGRHYSVTMVEHSLETVYYDYACAPKLDLNAYLTARITDWETLNLLEGEASLFFEGTFVGKTLLNVRNLTDTMSVSLGPDRNVVVSRTKIKDSQKDNFLGNKRRETRAWEIEVRNQKRQPIHLVVEDQFPVSQTDEIEVEYVSYEGASLGENTGLLTWKLDLKPAESRKLEFRYEVKFPKGKSVALE